MLDFPDAPVVGQVFQNLTWDGVKWTSVSSTALAPLNSPVFVGDPQAPTALVGDADQSLATTAFVARAVAPALRNAGRNYLDNARFQVWQRGLGPFTVSGLSADRWSYGYSGTGASISVQATSLTDADRAAIGDESAIYGMTVTFAGTGAAGDYNQAFQMVEDVRALAGKTVTASFWAKCNTAPLNLGIGTLQLFGSGGSPSAPFRVNGQAVALSTTWQRYSVTITLPSAAGKTLGTSGGDCTQLAFWFSSGSTYAANAGNPGVQSGTVSIFGVQFEEGSVVSPLTRQIYQQDLARCQRFYQIGYLQANGYGQQVFALDMPLPVVMRVTPTITSNFTTLQNCTVAVSSYFPAMIQYVTTITAAGMFNSAGTFTASADL
jgi:hypothetical protein